MRAPLHHNMDSLYTGEVGLKMKPETYQKQTGKLQELILGLHLPKSYKRNVLSNLPPKQKRQVGPHITQSES